MAGLDLRLSVDSDPICCSTLAQNQVQGTGRVLQMDIAALEGRGLRALAGVRANQPLVVVGGPPCQPFSKASYWTDSGSEAEYRRGRANGKQLQRPKPISAPKPDARRSLAHHFVALAADAKADAIIFENVPSILHPRNKADFELIVSYLERREYRTEYAVLNAAHYGVAQSRQRLVLVAAKSFQPRLPDPTHSTDVAGGLDLQLRPTVGAAEAIAEFQNHKYHEREEIVEGRWKEALFQIPAGQNYKALTSWAGHPQPLFEAETRFWHFLLKLHPKRPSWTVAASPGPWTGPFHWDSRRLRTVELAALQSFPGDYVFQGSRREKVRQIGNAFPPLLAAKVLHEVKASLEDVA